MKNVLGKIETILKKNDCVVFGYLFGSRAKGYTDIKSDWDIAVYLKPKCLKDWSRFYIEADNIILMRESLLREMYLLYL